MTDRTLEYLDEPKMELYQEFPTVRFFWSRCFDPDICITVGENEPGFYIRVKVIEWIDRTRIFTTNETRPLGIEDWITITDSIDELDLWNAEPSRREGIDGAHWHLELLSNGRYRSMYAWYPPDDCPVRIFGLMLLKVSGLVIAPDRIY